MKKASKSELEQDVKSILTDKQVHILYNALTDYLKESIEEYESRMIDRQRLMRYCVKALLNKDY